MSKLASEWEIRPIQPKSIFRMNFCSEGTCSSPATHYLVLLPQPRTMRQRESRMRRCEKHARENAERMGLAFPEQLTRHEGSL
jgi:hypothetical protein